MTPEETKAIALISEAAELLGWQIIFSTEDIKYIIIAHPEVADQITTSLEE